MEFRLLLFRSFKHRCLFYDAHLRDHLGKPGEQAFTYFWICHLASPEPHRDAHLIPVLQELEHLARLDLEIMLTDIGAEPHPLDVPAPPVGAAALLDRKSVV